MKFSFREDAYNFYNQFRDFSIRKSYSYKSKTSGEIIRRKYCCNKKGYKRKINEKKEKTLNVEEMKERVVELS